jgi:hypothetical protein
MNILYLIHMFPFLFLYYFSNWIPIQINFTYQDLQYPTILK